MSNAATVDGISLPEWDEPGPEIEGVPEGSSAPEPAGEPEAALVPAPAPMPVMDPALLREASQRGDRAREIMQAVRKQFWADTGFDMDVSEPEYTQGLWLYRTYEAIAAEFDARVVETITAEGNRLALDTAQAVAKIEVATRTAIDELNAACDRIEDASIKAARSAQEVDAMLRTNTSLLANAMGGHTQTLVDQTRGCMAGLVSDMRKVPEAPTPAPAVPVSRVQAIVKLLFGIK